MTVRAWFRQMRSTSHGADLARVMDRILTAPRDVEMVYDVAIVADDESYEAWQRKGRLVGRMLQFDYTVEIDPLWGARRISRS